MWDNFFTEQLYDNIIRDDRWIMYLEGLGNTILITLGAAVLGIILGSLVAICKVYARNNKALRPVSWLCDIYITVIRGTPVMVQLMIIYYVIFASAPMEVGILIAMFGFGLNSGAYVAEIVRAGIQAVDVGQTEAGRSLGLTNNRTMVSIVFPQAIKNILPALGNEAIVLFKETSIVGYIAIADLTYKATLIRSRTYDPVPLLVIALIYLLVVLLMTWGLRALERRLARSDYR